VRKCGRRSSTDTSVLANDAEQRSPRRGCRRGYSVLLGVKQRVERQHDDAGTHAAPERHRKIDGVVEQETQPLFRAQPEIFQRAGETAKCAFATRRS